jgi:ornithine cyclodeaminase/alanine dehydrogenase-like protein (mu-crystallin family)
MAVTLGYGAIGGAIGMREAIDLLERAAAHEVAGRTCVSAKFVSEFERGSMRILFAADYEAGYFATKAYNTIEGVGTRYVVSLYRLADGELLALIDGRLITDLRTGAASGVIARRVSMPGPVTVGVIGSGNQARTQLESLAAVYAIESAAVYSPTAANREAYAREMSAKLGFPVVPVASAEAAVRGRAVVASASSARGAEPVVRGEWLAGCRLLCAVGNTRAKFAEADVRCFGDARRVVVDSWHAIEESGDLIRAAAEGALPEAKRASLAQVATGAVGLPAEGLIAFKSVGTALQDLALAGRYYEILGERGGVPTAPDHASLRASGGRARA